MASNIPTQERTVDPFSSYGSDIVNQLTRMVTRDSSGAGWLNGPNDLDVIADGTSVNTALLQTGVIFKDDMQIFITSEFTVNFLDSTQYFSSGGTLNETGYYYVTIEYAFVKSRPAPQAAIKIIRPSERVTTFPNSNLTFLKAVEVDTVASSNEIVDFFDYDPDNTSVARVSIQQFASTEIFLPTFNRLLHQGRIEYAKNVDQFYYGKSSEWVLAGTSVSVSETIASPGGWTSDSGLFRGDVDITVLNTMNAVVAVRRTSDHKIISPSDLEFTSVTNLRVWMPSSAVAVQVTVVA